MKTSEIETIRDAAYCGRGPTRKFRLLIEGKRATLFGQLFEVSTNKPDSKATFALKATSPDYDRDAIVTMTKIFAKGSKHGGRYLLKGVLTYVNKSKGRSVPKSNVSDHVCENEFAVPAKVQSESKNEFAVPNRMTPTAVVVTAPILIASPTANTSGASQDAESDNFAGSAKTDDSKLKSLPADELTRRGAEIAAAVETADPTVVAVTDQNDAAFVINSPKLTDEFAEQESETLIKEAAAEKLKTQFLATLKFVLDRCALGDDPMVDMQFAVPYLGASRAQLYRDKKAGIFPNAEHCKNTKWHFSEVKAYRDDLTRYET